MFIHYYFLLCYCYFGHCVYGQEVVAKLKDSGKWVSFMNLRASFGSDVKTQKNSQLGTTKPPAASVHRAYDGINAYEEEPQLTTERSTTKKTHKIVPISSFRFSAVNQERHIVIVKTKKDDALQEITTTTTTTEAASTKDKTIETLFESSTFSGSSEDDEDLGRSESSGRIEEYVIPVATTTTTTTTEPITTDHIPDETTVEQGRETLGPLDVATPAPDSKSHAESTEHHEDEEVIIAALEDAKRLGPKYEVLDELHLPDAPPIEIRTIEHGTIDGGLLDHELMSVDVQKWNNQTELRERLQNISLLEENGGERHRDLGSSFILPVLTAANYDNNTVPLAYLDIPVNVIVQLNVLYLSNFNSELMEYSIDIEMQLSWYDLRLANNYSKPVRIREKQILDQIWRPDPYFVNSKHSYLHKVSFPNMRMIVYPDGLIKYTIRATSICDCFMRFCLYPHDRQTCDMKISSIAYPSSYVRFHWHSDPIHFQSEFTLPELHIEQIRTEECVVPGKLLRSSCLRLVFELERDGSRFLVEKYIPSTLAMMFAWVAPHVPYNYEDVRIVTPITVLLTLVQMEKGDQEIRTSYLTSMDIWFAAMKMFTVLSLIESLTVLALIKQSRAMEKNAQKAANELYRLNFEKEARQLKRLYHNLDAVCRVLTPIVFAIFFAYYVSFVAQGDDTRCLKKN